MGHIYTEFDTTPGASGATVLAAVKAAILTSTDYSNPSGSIVQATATSGATICLELAGGGTSDNQRIRPKAWRGAGGTNGSVQRSLYWNAAGNNSASVLHCKIAAGPTLLYIEIEGPRAAELGTDSTFYGSLRQSVWIADLTPYIAGDATPCVVFGGSTSIPGTETTSGSFGISELVHVSRNQAATSEWVQARLVSMMPPVFNVVKPQNVGYQPVASDGTTILWPYVVVEEQAGLRGRLTDVFYAGVTGPSAYDSLPGIAPATDVTYGGKTYRTTQAYKSDGARYVFGSLGAAGNNSGNVQNNSVVAAIRKA